MGDDLLAEEFELSRSRLRGVAYRMLGSLSEADDAVQESWLRLSRADASQIDNLEAWLTTVVGRICLDMLRSRTIRREEPLPAPSGEPPAEGTDPEQEALLADSIGSALLVVLATLTPTERLAFVLHDMFAVSFEEIAVIVGRSPAAARQLASRARNRVQTGAPTPSAADLSRRREIVDAFLAAARGGDLVTLLRLLDPDVVLRADDTAARMGSTGDLRGADVVARFFAGRAQGAHPAVIDGRAGAVVIAGGQIRIAVSFTIAGDRITAIEATADPIHLATLRLTMPGG